MLFQRKWLYSYAKQQRILGRWQDLMLLATWRFLRNSQKVYGVIYTVTFCSRISILIFSFRNGDIVECRQDLIPKSAYQSHIETGSTPSEESPHDSGSQLTQGPGDIRYWSDFDRVYYLPRSLQKLPDPPEWKSTYLGWNQGYELFTRHNEVDMNIGYQMEWIEIDMIGCRTC
jgi:Tubulin domain